MRAGSGPGRGHLIPPESVPKSAITAWRRLTTAQQCRVIDEIISTRGNELRAAYPNVVGLGLGLQRRRNAAGAPQTNRRGALHLRFLVGRKWREARDSDSARSGRIPRFVLACTGALEDRVLLAVPTDVAARYAPSRIRRQSLGILVDAGATLEAGSLACVIQHGTGATANYYAASCRHVLSAGGTQKNAVTGLDGQALGVASTFRGSDGGEATPAFDAQLVALPDRQTARDVASNGLRFGGIATLADQLESGLLRIDAASAFDPLPVTFHTIWSIEDTERVGDDIYPHRRMIEVTFDEAATFGGDSGSPLYIDGSQRLLAGMHVALTRIGTENVSLCIPVWDLLDPELYGAPKNSRWQVL